MGQGERTFGRHFRAMFNEVRKRVRSAGLRGTCPQAQKCTMDVFCDLDMSHECQRNALERKKSDLKVQTEPETDVIFVA